MKNILFIDEEIRDNLGRRFYLRTKYTRLSGKIIWSVRTARYGKGNCVARVVGTSCDAMYKCLVKKWRKFRFVILVPYSGID